MKFTDFKKGLDQKNEYPIYLFEGEDAYFRLRGLNLLKTAFVSEPTLNFISFGGDVVVSELCSSLDAFPFMSEKRITAVSEFYPDKNELKVLKPYLENPSSDSVLVILNEKKCEALKKFDKVLFVDCNRQSADVLVAWIKSECKRNNVTIEPKACDLIVNYCLSDMSRIENETHKLIYYVGENGNVTVKDVEENVSQDTEYKIYEMTDYIGRGKYDQALKVVNDLLTKGEPEQKLLVSVYNYYRRLLHVAISDKTYQELAKDLGVQEFVVKKTAQQASMFKKRALKKAVDTLVQVDFDTKSGNLEQNQALWLTIFKIMSDK